MFLFLAHSRFGNNADSIPRTFPLSRKNKRKCLSIFAIVVMGYFLVVGAGFGHEAVERGMV